MLTLRMRSVLCDDSASSWLKNAILSLEKRDPIDAANDAQVLYALCEERCEEIARNAMQEVVR